MENTEKTILLVVDDESAVCRALRRMLKGKVDEIVAAQTPNDALIVLETRPVTHVLCDHLFGPGQPMGLQLCADWKTKFPTVKKLILLTGTNTSKLIPPKGVDHVLPKTIDREDLSRFLELS